MAGVRIEDDELIVERSRNDRDDLAIRLTGILDGFDVSHVSGYVTILAGRPRATEGTDVLPGIVDDDTIDRLVDSQLESARETGLGTDHYRRLDRTSGSEGADEE